jgi:radical SAM protein with 4Fe4S-binding SPASM domain
VVLVVQVVDILVPVPVHVQAAHVPAPVVAGNHHSFSNAMKVFSSTKNNLKNNPESTIALRPGVHHFLIKKENEKARIHLRVEQDGNGILLINASRIYNLNPSATMMAHMLLKDTPEKSIIQQLCKSFRVTAKQAKTDLEQFAPRLNSLVHPDGSCPIHDLGVETTTPFSNHPSAPYRMDLAITYLCNNDCSHCYNVKTRQKDELSTEKWNSILDGLWKIGIPHIVFTGGEPTLRSDLPDLIAHAEKNGQIAGINTNGRKLNDKYYVDSLAEAGLDHVQITIESQDSTVHDRMVQHVGAWNETVAGIKNALASNLFVMTNSTLLNENSAMLSDLLDFLADLGVPTVGLNALIYSGRGKTAGTGLAESELPLLLELAQKKTEQNHQRLIWYTPTRYCHFDPTQLQLGVKGCTAALYNMCIEPDGSVIPCQSYYESLGNFLTESWDSIWNHELAVRLRERKYVPFDCLPCPLLIECGGGCPLAESISHPQPFRVLQSIHF